MSNESVFIIGAIVRRQQELLGVHGALPVPYMPELVTHGSLIALGILMRLLALGPRAIAGPLFASQCRC